MTDILNVYLGATFVGHLTLLSGDRSFFAFDEAYLNSPDRPVLSQSFVMQSGDLLSETKTVKTKLPPFFSNLLPEGHLRTYLAARGGVKEAREFKLIELLGEDLPGAVVVNSVDGATLKLDIEGNDREPTKPTPYHFSLAGVQLKFSALAEKKGGLTIPTSGVGGDWILKLPAQNFANVPENEWSMMHLAGEVGIPVPEIKLVGLDDISGLPDLGILSSSTAFAVKRFDRGSNGERIHIEDFAQVYNVFPNDKYDKVSYANIANMVWTLTGENGLLDFISRLVFSLVIGNGDMHLKNWSFIYSDRRTPSLSPAYDFVSTVPYIPDDKFALSLSNTKDMSSISLAHFKKLANKAQVPEFLVLSTVKQTVEIILQAWGKNKSAYPISEEIVKRIDRHIENLKIS